MYSERNVAGKPLQVILFGNPRVNAYLRLSEAYRSLSRPSSPASAKAFTIRPLYLVLLQKLDFRAQDASLIGSFGSIKLSIITLRAVVKELRLRVKI
jgi:hypothetical protein